MKRVVFMMGMIGIVACGSKNDPVSPAPRVARVEITGVFDGVALGSANRLRLTAYDSAAKVVSISGTPRWSSTDSSVAYIDPDGVLYAHRLGQVVLRATIAIQGAEYSDSHEVSVIGGVGAAKATLTK